MKRILLFILAILIFASTACANGGLSNMNISIQITSDLSAGQAGSSSHKLTATLANNSSATAFYKLLQKAPLTIKLNEYGGFEKVGSIGSSLPRNDKQIATTAGDIMLYQGNQITIFYNNNSWNYTRLGKVNGVTQSELKQILGKGDVTAIFEITE